ncbi:hypothetical protein ACSSS7_003836 [Eimeria intestinalis]
MPYCSSSRSSSITGSSSRSSSTTGSRSSSNSNAITPKTVTRVVHNCLQAKQPHKNYDAPSQQQNSSMSPAASPAASASSSAASTIISNNNHHQQQSATISIPHKQQASISNSSKAKMRGLPTCDIWGPHASHLEREGRTKKSEENDAYGPRILSFGCKDSSLLIDLASHVFGRKVMQGSVDTRYVLIDWLQRQQQQQQQQQQL